MRAYEFLTEKQLDEINRRDFLKKAGMAAAGAALGTVAVDQDAHADTLIPNTMAPDIPKMQDAYPDNPTSGYLATHPNLTPQQAGQQMRDEMRSGFAYSVWQKNGKNTRAGIAMSAQESVFIMGNAGGDFVFVLILESNPKPVSPKFEISFGGWFDSHEVTVEVKNGEYYIPATKELLRAILDNNAMDITYETVDGEFKHSFKLNRADEVVKELFK